MQPISGGNMPNIVIVKNKAKLKVALDKIKKTINDIYEDGVNAFFSSALIMIPK